MTLFQTVILFKVAVTSLMQTTNIVAAVGLTILPLTIRAAAPSDLCLPVPANPAPAAVALRAAAATHPNLSDCASAPL